MVPPRGDVLPSVATPRRIFPRSREADEMTAALSTLPLHPLFIPGAQWRSQNEAEETMAPTETNLLRFLLVFCINF